MNIDKIKYKFLRSDKKWLIWDWDNDLYIGLLIWLWLWFIDVGNNRIYLVVILDNVSIVLLERESNLL